MSLLHRGRKPNRPAEWEEWDIDRKITWLKNRRKLTASELKELRYLTQSKKFSGFKDWVAKRREEEKKTDTYKKKLEQKCRKRREVGSCKECCRYEHCVEGKPLYKEESYIGELRLGHAIILSIEEDIRRCYRHGWKDQMAFWLKVLASQRTNILTAETVDGYASAQAVLRDCYQKYGDFEPIYKKCQETYFPVLKDLEKKLSKVKYENKRALKISEQITQTRKKLYGDTM